MATNIVASGTATSKAFSHAPGNGTTGYYRVVCDRATFVILDCAYAKDKDRAYWGGKPIEDADLATFESAGKYGAKDARGLSSGGRRRDR